ncbi:MAG: methyltransferase domain-containing protein [Chromatiaceae bacterium]|jgi:SAM-dependent methyltransferase|nr:methyltransferase domain-containing protein [Chromatiaceae bacterium]
MRPRPLTQLAQQSLRELLRPGDRVIDATLGNGHDTLFLARQVAPGGRVVGFDVQQRALEQTRARLADAGLDGVVSLQLGGHERMVAGVPADWHGQVAAVMFNLGYLPGADKALTTRAATTVAALDQAASLLRIGGQISLLVYRGHAGGADEASAVAGWLGRLGACYRVTRHDSPGPLLFLIERLG